MKQKTILITGANGEIGHGLIHYVSERYDAQIIALDVHTIDDDLKPRCAKVVIGDILDNDLIEQLAAQFEFDSIFHLAAVLSTKAERQPLLGHKVNVDGTLNLLAMASEQARAEEREVKFLYPSSIAVYGLPSIAAKQEARKVKEEEWLEPRTMYGINKLYGENLGRYYGHYFRQLDVQPIVGKVDFRAIRFPGLISAHTLPTGGTSDFAPEMLHQAAKGEPYDCFVRSDATIPFMAMPDAVRALLMLEEAPKEGLTKTSYNIGAFSPSAGELEEHCRKYFPNGKVQFIPDERRQAIVDSWPADVDDNAARRDWKWSPDYGFERAFDDYLVPAVKKRYGKA